MYMNGQGIREHTDKLVNEMWDSTESAFYGGCFGIVVIPTAGILTILGLFHWLWLVPIFVVCFEVWRRYSYRWRKVKRDLKTHRLACERETEIRGQGWARS